MKLKNKLILAYVMLHSAIFVQSCSSMRSNRSSIMPITGEQLLSHGLLQPVSQRSTTLRDEDQPLIEELRKKIRKLKEKNFIEGRDGRNNDNIRKHLMFVFYNWLLYRQSKITWDRRMSQFSQIMQTRSATGLLWTPVLVNRGMKQVVHFKLNNLFTNSDPFLQENLNARIRGRAPVLPYNNQVEQVHIDHLFRDDRVTIELPKSLHEEKTQVIDNLINISIQTPVRNSTEYWRNRN